MARWVVGRNAWRAADQATQQAFMTAFKTLMIRSYANSLLEYAHYTLDFLVEVKKNEAQKEKTNTKS